MADLRWGRPELVAAVAEHVEDIESGDDRLWVTAAGWLVHGRSAVGDGREAAAAALEQLPQRAAGLAHEPAAHRLRVEIALLAAAAGEYTVARALVAPVVLASAAAEDRADALGVLARCVAEERPEAVDQPARQAELAWAEVGGPHGETGAATVALVAATGLRRAGRPGAAVERAAAGLSRLDRVRGRHPATPSRHLGAALAAEWIGALLDAGRADEAREGCIPLEPRLREAVRPSRQMALLRLTVARALVASSPSAAMSSNAVVDALEQAAGDAAASDAPDLEAVCLSTLGALHEKAGRLGAALDFTRRAVEARHRDAARRDRFLDALQSATLLTVVEEPAFDPWVQPWTPDDGDDTPIGALLARTFTASAALSEREPVRDADPLPLPDTDVAGRYDPSQQGVRARRSDAAAGRRTNGSAGHRLNEPSSTGGAQAPVPWLAPGRPDEPAAADGASGRDWAARIAIDPLGVDRDAGRPGTADPRASRAGVVDPLGVGRDAARADSGAAVLRDDWSQGAAAAEPQHPLAEEPRPAGSGADRWSAGGRAGGRRRRRDDDDPVTGSDRPDVQRPDFSERPRAPWPPPELGRPAAVWPDAPGRPDALDQPLGQAGVADPQAVPADPLLPIDGAPASLLAPAGRPDSAGAAAAGEPDRWDTSQDSWLQAALAELDRVWGPAAPAAPEPSANGTGCTVVVDVVRAGVAMSDGDPTGVLRAVAERLAGAVPVGGRLRRDEHMVSVILPGWDRAEAGAWMRASLPDPFATLVSPDHEPGTALRAAVHDMDGPVGAQLLQRLDAVPSRRADAGRHDATDRPPFAADQLLPSGRPGRRRRAEGDVASWPAGHGRADRDPTAARTDTPATGTLLGDRPPFAAAPTRAAPTRAASTPAASSPAAPAIASTLSAAIRTASTPAPPAGAADAELGLVLGLSTASSRGIDGAASDASTGSGAFPVSGPAAADRGAIATDPWTSPGASPTDRSAPTHPGASEGSTAAVLPGSVAADPDTAGLGIADLLAGALAAYRGW